MTRIVRISAEKGRIRVLGVVGVLSPVPGKWKSRIGHGKHYDLHLGVDCVRRRKRWDSLEFADERNRIFVLVVFSFRVNFRK